MKQKKVCIIDYELGNLFSITESCKKSGFSPTVTNNREEILDADALILPGVGAFNVAMNNLKKLNLVDSLSESFKKGKPFFGICLGFQVLFEKSTEFGEHQGLNFIPGIVNKFPSFFNGQKLKIPHIGWNTAAIFEKNKKNQSPLYQAKPNDMFYFVHSFQVSKISSDITLSETKYNEISFVSSIHKDNLFATQFHPEKSGVAGLKIIRNWAKQNKII